MRQRIPLAHQTLQARFLPVFFVFVCISSLYIFAIFKQDKLNQTNVIVLIALILFAILLSFLPRISRIEIDNDGFVKYLFKGKRNIKWSEINKVYTEWQFHGHGASLHLCFNFTNGTNYNLPLTFYSRKSMKILCESIVSACPQADISQKVKNMASDNFPWYLH